MEFTLISTEKFKEGYIDFSNLKTQNPTKRAFTHAALSKLEIVNFQSDGFSCNDLLEFLKVAEIRMRISGTAAPDNSANENTENFLIKLWNDVLGKKVSIEMYVQEDIVNYANIWIDKCSQISLTVKISDEHWIKLMNDNVSNGVDYFSVPVDQCSICFQKF
jgi:hypothetical protein